MGQGPIKEVIMNRECDPRQWQQGREEGLFKNVIADSLATGFGGFERTTILLSYFQFLFSLFYPLNFLCFHSFYTPGLFWDTHGVLSPRRRNDKRELLVICLCNVGGMWCV